MEQFITITSTVQYPEDDVVTPPLVKPIYQQLENEITKLNQFIDSSYVKPGPLYLTAIHLLEQVISSLDNHEILKLANDLTYKLIFYLEGEPHYDVVLKAVDFAYRRSIYFVNPFWFIGIINPISKKSPNDRVLYQRADYVRTLKLINDIYSDQESIITSTVILYCRFLMHQKFRDSVLNYIPDSNYFFKPFFEVIKNSNHHHAETFYYIIWVFQKLRNIQNGDKYNYHFIEKIRKFENKLQENQRILINSF